MDDLDKEFDAHLAATPEAKKDDLDKEFESHLSEPSAKTIGKAEAFGRGALKQGTLGLSTEAVPALEATADILKNPDIKKWHDAYRQHQAEYVANNEEAYKQHPYAYGAGSVVGAGALGLASAGLGSGLGFAGEGAIETRNAIKAAQAAGEIEPEVAQALLGDVGKRIIANRAATGAAIGGVNAAATSKGNIDTAEGNKQLLKDTGVGALVGAPLNVATSAAVEGAQGLLGKGAQKAGNAAAAEQESFINQNPNIRQPILAYKEGLKGNALNNTTDASQRLSAEKTQDVADVTNKLLNARQTVGQLMGHLRDTAEQQGVKVDLNELKPGFQGISETLQKYPNLAKANDIGELVDRVAGKDTEPIKQQLIQKLAQYKEASANPPTAPVDTSGGLLGTQEQPKAPDLGKMQQDIMGLYSKLKTAEQQNTNLTPNEAFKLRQGLYNMLESVKPEQDADFRSQLINIIKPLGQKEYDSVNGLEEASGLFKNINQAGPEALLGKGLDPELNSKYFSDLTKAPEDLGNKVGDILNDLTSPGVSGEKNQGAFWQSMKQLRALEAQNPGLMDSIGIGNLDKFQADIINKADKAALRQQTLGYNPQTTSVAKTLLGGIGSTAKAGVNKIANIAGRVVGGVSHSGLGQATRDVYNLPQTSLNSLADHLEQNVGANNPVVSTFKKAVQNNDIAKRNSTLFSLLQSPNTRDLITKHINQGDQSNNNQ